MCSSSRRVYAGQYPTPRSSLASRRAALERRPASRVLLIIWIYLGIWVVLKPPHQSPDEAQHLLRASSVRLQPWATRTPNTLTLDRRFLNPFVRFPTADLGDLFFNRQGQLSYEAIARLKAIPWDLPPETPSYLYHAARHVSDRLLRADLRAGRGRPRRCST